VKRHTWVSCFWEKVLAFVGAPKGIGSSIERLEVIEMILLHGLFVILFLFVQLLRWNLIAGKEHTINYCKSLIYYGICELPKAN
jgi:hypothetical protein